MSLNPSFGCSGDYPTSGFTPEAFDQYADPSNLLTSIEDAALLLQGILVKWQPLFDVHAQQVGGQPLKKIFNYYTEDRGNFNYPCVMMQEMSQTTTWYGLPNIAYWDFSFQIYYLFQSNDPDLRPKIRRRMQSVFQFALLSEAHDQTVNGRSIQFLDDRSPTPSTRYVLFGSPDDGNPIVSGFIMEWHCQCVQFVEYPISQF